MTEIVQGSEEWLQIRLGKLTASRMADAAARTKTGWGASRSNLMAELIVERLTGKTGEKFTNDAMRWGTEYEPEARNAYEFMKNCDVTQIGFIPHPSIEMSGASPDGLIGDVGLVEIKCPNSATHLETLLGSEAPAKYVTQMQWQMACAGRAWCDFVSYDPRMPENMRIFVKRIHRDPARVAELEQIAREFLLELDQKLDALRQIYDRSAA